MAENYSVVVRQIRKDIEKLREERAAIEQKVAAFETTLRYYEELAIAPAGAEGSGFRTPGRALDDAIYEVLEEVDRPMHYREVYTALRARGITVPGSNPAANVLSHMSADKVRFVKLGQGRWDIRRSPHHSVEASGASLSVEEATGTPTPLSAPRVSVTMPSSTPASPNDFGRIWQDARRHAG